MPVASAVHADLDLTHISFTDSTHSYRATSGALLVTSKQIGKLVLLSTVGDRNVYAVDAFRIGHYTNGFIWSGGIRYTPLPWFTFGISAGQDVGFSHLVGGGADFQHFLRFDSTFHLF